MHRWHAKARAEQDDGTHDDGAEQEGDLEQPPPIPTEQPQAIGEQRHRDQINPDEKSKDSIRLRRKVAACDDEFLVSLIKAA